MVVLGNVGRRLRTGRYIDYPATASAATARPQPVRDPAASWPASDRESFGMPEPRPSRPSIKTARSPNCSRLTSPPRPRRPLPCARLAVYTAPRFVARVPWRAPTSRCWSATSCRSSPSSAWAATGAFGKRGARPAHRPRDAQGRQGGAPLSGLATPTGVSCETRRRGRDARRTEASAAEKEHLPPLDRRWPSHRRPTAEQGPAAAEHRHKARAEGCSPRPSIDKP